jgi:5,10-methylenetetrahydromethanopterin reductase
MTEAVRLAEQRGFESAWMTNDIGGRTPYVVLATWATVTESIRLGVAVSNPVTRHPVELAQTVATLDEACNGRVVLGLGTGISWRSIVGDQWARPIALMRESMQVLRELWAQPETTFRGASVSIRESDWIWPDGPAASIRKNIPIYMGARSAQMTRLGARRADGMLLEVGRYVPDIADQVAMFRATAEKAGRDPDALEVGALVTTCAVDGDQEPDVMRRLIAFQTHRLTQEEAGRRGTEPQTYRTIKAIYDRHAAAGGRVMYGSEPAAYEAAPHVTLDMLRAYAVVGTPTECARQLEKYVAAGVTLPILMPAGCDIASVIETGEKFLSQN